MNSYNLIKQEIGPFPVYPGSHFKEDFLRHVKETGQPDLWKWHEPSPPPKNKDFVEICNFEIPEKLRLDVGMASCPICSPYSPKYYEGKLAWFEEEGVLRAIGHECGEKHFGSKIHNAARAGRIHREAKESAQNYLLATLPKVHDFRLSASKSMTIAKEIDSIKRQFLAKATKTACLNFVKKSKNGALEIFENTNVFTINRFGHEQKNIQSILIDSIPVQGGQFLTHSFSLEKQVENTIIAFLQVRAVDDEEALELLTTIWNEDEYLFEAEKLTKNAIFEYQKFKKAIKEAQSFLKRSNLLNMIKWAEDNRTDSPIQIIFNKNNPKQLLVGKANQPLSKLNIIDISKFPKTKNGGR